MWIRTDAGRSIDNCRKAKYKLGLACHWTCVSIGSNKASDSGMPSGMLGVSRYRLQGLILPWLWENRVKTTCGLSWRKAPREKVPFASSTRERSKRWVRKWHVDHNITYREGRGRSGRASTGAPIQCASEKHTFDETWI